MRIRSLVAIVAACVLAASAESRAQASAYVPLDDIAYTYVDALMSRGLLPELSALERPFAVNVLRGALDSARTRSPGTTVTTYLDALTDAIDKYSVRRNDVDSAAAETFRARGTGDLYVTSQTSGRRELMLSDHRNKVAPGGSIRLVMSGGPVVGFTRALIDSRLTSDPEFPGRTDRKINGRIEDGYVGAQWRFGEISLGRVGRDWGPSKLGGLMLSNYAYTYDHLYGRLGTQKINWSTVIARLNDSLTNSGLHIDRYFSIHRLAIHVGKWELAGSESYVYSGVGRGFEPSVVNPLNIYSLSWRNEKLEGNLGLGAEVALRTDKYGLFSGQLFIDDLQIDRGCGTVCTQPSSYGLSLSAEGLPLAGDQRWFASYTRVSNLAYRNKVPSDTYENFGVGLARGFSDYDEVRAGLDLAMLPRTPLRVYAARRRQGEGSYNMPFPLPAEWASTPGMFSGIVMGVTRVGISGVSRLKDFEFSGDVGVNHETSSAHVTGATRTAFEGRVKVAIEPRWTVNF
ncbi:MAG TPA: hypothetical protein VGD02_07080 [Gemmatimonadaceae bacterium]